MATKGMSRTDTGAATHYFPITPDDLTDLAVETREIIIAVGGNIVLTRLDGSDVTLTMPAGRFALRAQRVKATGTTATGITGVV